MQAVLTINGEQLLQVQLVWHVAQFVMKEDGVNTLLILYYAGHGTPGPRPGALKLSGHLIYNQAFGNDLLMTFRKLTWTEEPHEVIWNYVEASLQCTRADVLEIFDW